MFHRYTEVAYLVATYRGEKMPSRKKMLSILVSSNCIDHAYPSPTCCLQKIVLHIQMLSKIKTG